MVCDKINLNQKILENMYCEKNKKYYVIYKIWSCLLNIKTSELISPNSLKKKNTQITDHNSVECTAFLRRYQNQNTAFTKENRPLRATQQLPKVHRVRFHLRSSPWGQTSLKSSAARRRSSCETVLRQPRKLWSGEFVCWRDTPAAESGPCGRRGCTWQTNKAGCFACGRLQIWMMRVLTVGVEQLEPVLDAVVGFLAIGFL